MNTSYFKVYFMRIKKAGELFHGDENYNCCQAVLKAFQDVCCIEDAKIEESRAYGGGRAEEGRCGALHAACMLFECDKPKDEIETEFIEKPGSHKCREIRSLGKYSCKDCVQLAAKLSQEKIK